MKTPYVNAVGLTVHPPDGPVRSSRVPQRRRLMAGVLIVVFGLVVVWTSIVSLGSYCLTSDGGDTRNLVEMEGSERTGEWLNAPSFARSRRPHARRSPVRGQAVP